jgi:hypothetical protein
LIDSIKCYGEYIKEQPFGVVFYETDQNSKLWRWDTANDEKYVIMYLNWEVGDTIFIKNKDFIMHYEDRAFGIVDSVFFDEKNRKIIHTDLVLNIDTTKFNLIFIEGVGPNASILYQEYYGFYWGNSHILLCAYKDNLISYLNTEVSDDCTYPKPVSINTEKAKTEVLIKYHSNTIELTFEHTFSGKLNLINTNGKLVKSKNINSNNKVIDINKVPAGIYIIQVSDKHGKLCSTKKIIKNKNQ